MEEKIPNTEEIIRIERTGNFRFKQVVSDFLIEVIRDSIVSAKKYIEITNYTTFCFGELQMHSIIIPALAKILIALFLNTLLNGKLEKKIIGDEWIITADAMQKRKMNIICF